MITIIVVSTVVSLIGLIGFLSLSNRTKLNTSRSETIFDNGMDDHLFDEHLILDASIDEYSSLCDVEEESEIIVVAEKVFEEDPTIVRNTQGRIDTAFTLSDFEVKKVVNGKLLSTGETFTILENEAFDEEKGLKYHILGYEKMITGSHYLLFLCRSETAPYYLVAGVNYGKIPLEKVTSDVNLSLHSANTEYATEVLENYNHIDTVRRQARIKYSQYISDYR